MSLIERKILVDNRVNNVNMTPANQHQIPTQTIGAQTVLHLLSGRPRLLTGDRCNHHYHTAEAKIHTFINLTEQYIKRKVP